MSNFKMPIPDHISQEAQDFLTPPISTREHDPAPQSTQEWLSFVEASNANYAPYVEAITSSPDVNIEKTCLLYTSPSPRDVEESRMPSSA